MDFISHGLWVYLVFRKKPWKLWAVFWGVFPDVAALFQIGYLVSIGGLSQIIRYLPIVSKKGIVMYPIPHAWMIPYYLTHSLVILGAVALLYYLLTKKKPLVLLGWVLHLMLDVFLHSGVYANRIFYPISNFKIDTGLEWENHWIFFVNWALLLGFYIFLLIRYIIKRKQRNNI